MYMYNCTFNPRFHIYTCAILCCRCISQAITSKMQSLSRDPKWFLLVLYTSAYMLHYVIKFPVQFS